MAQNPSYRTANLARDFSNKPAKKKVLKRYKAAVWTKNERRLVFGFALGTLIIMLATVYTSVQTDNVLQKNVQTQRKMTQIKQDNDSLRADIQKKINRQNLDDVAKKSKMSQTGDSVRNINQ
ncbi:hypothetical protein [Convivina intestini]|uniref:Cell division protein FtsL n=1 Tax=Convivina intestini TaxID=1505726 RepID=A0A2U1D960_9LACO|nr:hypothetical protein [Convivina intestini]PVY84169.1 cell division protein FtsL [Convivina intestini]CAH1854320.1 Cell division protein FtsL [Convivina intestini]CAH1854689.1 Cell division protein FtsL [Convivina intestini]SDB91061.1 cell division protein FtsL [Leuconostocaceae bacterium R-53105]